MSVDEESAPENGSGTVYFIHDNKRRRRREGYIKSIGGRLKGLEKARRGNL